MLRAYRGGAVFGDEVCKQPRYKVTGVCKFIMSEL